jgi:hypothetical protein
VRLTSTAYFELAICPKEELNSSESRGQVEEERGLFEQMLNSSAIGIGLTSDERYDMHSFPGWRDGSVAYHSDDGKLFLEVRNALLSILDVQLTEGVDAAIVWHGQPF